MVGIYFSGTGNTEHCVKELVKNLSTAAECFSLEDSRAIAALQGSEDIVFGYPVYYSNLPKIVRDFITAQSELWRGKRIFIVATMGLFSGDGAGCSARLFRKYGATVLGGLHLKMPDCIGDVKVLKRSEEKNKELVKKAEEKINRAAQRIQGNRYPKDGLGPFSRMAGFFGQRLYFCGKTKKYFSNVRVKHALCLRCGRCSSLCPMQNIRLTPDGIVFNGRCTMCYRCFANCPAAAINLLGKRTYQQYRFQDNESKSRSN